jgi:hypothetical protein
MSEDEEDDFREALALADRFLALAREQKLGTIVAAVGYLLRHISDITIMPLDDALVVVADEARALVESPTLH